MQSQRRLQEGAVGVVINFLARQKGRYVTWLPACGNTMPAPATDVNLVRCRLATTAEWVIRHRMPLLLCLFFIVYSALLVHDTPSPCFGLTRRSHDWSVSQVVWGWGGNIGHWYCLRGAGYRKVRCIQLLLTENAILCGYRHVRIIRICMKIRYTISTLTSMKSSISWHAKIS